MGPNNDNLTPGSRNYPSRTGIDLNGDMFVANRAFGGQPSVTKIYNRDCQDRNGDGRIQTSQDVNGNNVIDRNDPNEFFGQNDECYAWTEAVGRNGGTARALAIDSGDGQNPYGNVWVGMYTHREFYGVQGARRLVDPATWPSEPSQRGSLTVRRRRRLQRLRLVGNAELVHRGWLRLAHTGRAGQPVNLGCRSYGFTLDGENRMWVGCVVRRRWHNPYRDATATRSKIRSQAAARRVRQPAAQDAATYAAAALTPRGGSGLQT